MLPRSTRSLPAPEPPPRPIADTRPESGSWTQLRVTDPFEEETKTGLCGPFRSVPDADDAATELRQPPEIALTPLMSPILPSTTTYLPLPPLDPTPPPEVAIRTPLAMAVPADDNSTRILPFATAPIRTSFVGPIEAEVLGQRLPMSRVALIVGSTLLLAALAVVGMRPQHHLAAAPSVPAVVSAEPLVPASPGPTVPPVARAAAEVAPATFVAPSASASATPPPARRAPARPRTRIPIRRAQ